MKADDRSSNFCAIVQLRIIGIKLANRIIPRQRNALADEDARSALSTDFFVQQQFLDRAVSHWPFSDWQGGQYWALVSKHSDKTRNKMRVAIESGKGMKVKVVKLCWNKWNGPFLMHIYDKQCGIMQKNQWKGPNFQIQCFYNGTSGALCWKRQKNTKTRETKTQITPIFVKVWPI